MFFILARTCVLSDARYGYCQLSSVVKRQSNESKAAERCPFRYLEIVPDNAGLLEHLWTG